MTLDALIAQLRQHPVDFNTVIHTIDTHYHFTPTAFHNGSLFNEAGHNNGSCKILAFAQLHGLSQQATLNAFGDFYTKEVRLNPDGQDHGNIRNFIQNGWSGVRFTGQPLTPKSGLADTN